MKEVSGQGGRGDETQQGRSILFFGDGTHETQTSLANLLQSTKTHSLAGIFLQRAQEALKQEQDALPPEQRSWFPSLDRIENVVFERGQTQPIPCLHPPEIILAQIASFISSYENSQEPYPTSENHLIVGLCFGELSASAVATASSLVELIATGVDAVRVAFRTGIVSQTTANDIESPTNPASSWAVTLSTETNLGDESTLKTLCDRLNCTNSRQAFVTALSRRTVTLGGCPSTLRAILDSLEASESGSKSTLKSRVGIYAPYHAGCLFSVEDAEHIVKRPFAAGASYNNAFTRSAPRSFISGFSGKQYKATSGQDLLQQVVFTIIARPILWDNAVSGCLNIIQDQPKADFTVRIFAPSAAAQALANILDKKSHHSVSYDATHGAAARKNFDQKLEPIAIVGISGRFPKAANVDEFWSNLQNGLDCHESIPKSRFDPETHLSHPAYGCFIDQPGLFDPRFFQMSSREALQTDPGQRLALVTTYEALEMSGFVPDRTPSTQLSRVGTFFGQVADEYKEQNLARDVDTYFIPGTMRAFGPGRINRFFQFGGPAYNVDTACSSSLVALHLACLSIRSGECDTAVWGGMNICCSSDNFQGLIKGHFLSTSGGCKTFDEHADGYCRGEAVGAVVIKKLSAAVADNDRILGKILSVGTNYNAQAESITRPHGETQERLYKDLLWESNLDANEIDYIEAHGTGTQVGDTVETNSILNVFAPTGPKARKHENPLLIGAVKANIGHGESASGVAAFIKSLMVMEHSMLPPHVGIKTKANPRLPDWQSRNVLVPERSTSLKPLPAGSERRIMVNNFSAAGGNTAAIVESHYNAPVEQQDFRRDHVITVSGKSLSALRGNMSHLATYVRQNLDKSNLSIADIGYTTTARRKHYQFRTSILAQSLETLLRGLSMNEQILASYQRPSKRTSLIFAFTGQSTFYRGMGKDLLLNAQFSSDLHRYEELCTKLSLPSFMDAMDDVATNISVLSPAQQQLAQVAVQMAMVKLLSSLGLQPSLVIGHSLGEYPALFAAGVLSASDVLFLVGRRALILEDLVQKNTHAMLAVNSSLGEISRVLGIEARSLDVAAINSPQDVTLSGSVELLTQQSSSLKESGIRCKILDLPFAFHSAQVDPILDQYEEVCKQVRFSKPSIAVYSSLLGEAVTEEGTFNPAYLRRHARECVNFNGAVEAILSSQPDDNIWVEIGPDPICLNMLRRGFKQDIASYPTLQRSQDSWKTLAQLLSGLYDSGFDINWNTYHRDFEHNLRLLPLPSYAFDNEDLWVPYKDDWLLNKNKAHQPLKGQDADSGPATLTVHRLVQTTENKPHPKLIFETNLHREDLRLVIAGHLMHGTALCPASVYADMALTVADFVRQRFEFSVATTGIDVASMEFIRPVIVSVEPTTAVNVLTIRSSADLDLGQLELEFCVNNAVHARCTTIFKDATKWTTKWARKTNFLIQSRLSELAQKVVTGTTHKLHRSLVYKMFDSTVSYAEPFRAMREVLLDSDNLEAAAVIQLSDLNQSKFYCSPYWIDPFMHLSGFVINVNERTNSDDIYIANGWRSMRFDQAINASNVYRAHVKLFALDETSVTGDISIFQGENIVGQIQDIKFSRIRRSLFETILRNHMPNGSEKPVNRIANNIGESSKAIKTKSTQPVIAESKGQKSDWQMQSSQASVRSAGDSSSQTSGSNVKQALNQLHQLIADEIGVPPEKLSDDSALVDLGVDSLLSLALAEKVRESMDIDLDQSVFQTIDTVSALKAHVESQLSARHAVNTPATTIATAGSHNSPETLQGAEPGGGQFLRQKLYHLVANEIGMRAEELNGAESLAELGVDSLMTLSILDNINTQLGVSINPSDLGSGLTMSTLESLVCPNESPNQKQALVPSSTSKPVPAQQDSSRIDLTHQSTISFLIQGNPRTAEHILFLLPDGSGAASSYIELPEISSSFAVYALNSPFLKSPAGYESVLQVSSLFVDEIRRRQPQGPYYIGGWSAGGYYAFEAAKRLVEEGSSIEKLILIDSPCRVMYEALSQELLDLLVQSRAMGSEDEAPPAWLVAHFSASIRKIAEYEPAPLIHSSAAQVKECYLIYASDGLSDAQTARAEGASVGPSPKVAAFLMHPREDWGPQGWDVLLPGVAMRSLRLPGNHFQIVRMPFARRLSELVGSALTQDPKDDAVWKGV